MTTKISASNLSDSLITTITAGGGPKITAIDVTDNAWTVLDDTAVDLAGGYIKITGTGFQSGCQVLINNTPATATTFVSSTEVRAQVPAATAGTYVVYLANSDGGVAIAINGITYSANPAWITASTLNAQIVDTPISIQLLATDATTYALAAGSSLPTGVTLTSGGLLSGTVTGITEDTTYSFTVVATDAENQDSPRSFSVTVTAIVADDYFNSTVLLLSGDGANSAQNNTFVDSSTNNFTVTPYSNASQGSFSPFSPTGWSNYFDGTEDYLEIANNAAFDFGTSDFTIEGFFNLEKDAAANPDGNRSAALVTCMFSTGVSSGWSIEIGGNSSTTGTGIGMSLWNSGNSTTPISYSTTFSKGLWYHFAFVRSGNNFTLYLNGTSVATGTTAVNANSGGFPCRIGATQVGTAPKYYHYFPGNISNVRVVKGSAVYTSNFTPSTIPLIAVSGTSLLTCQSNRFVDNSTNNFTITRTGDTKVVAFSPFAPAEAYDTATHGGSVWLDGSNDYLSIPDNVALQVTGESNFTIEAWVYITTTPNANYGAPVITKTAGNNGWELRFQPGGFQWVYPNVAGYTFGPTLNLNEWYHVAIVKSAGTISGFVNGVQYSISVGNTTWGGGTDAVRIGTGGYGYVPGYISGVRIVKGTAVYTANFTPPTAPLEAITDTSLLLNFTNAGILDATTKNVLETVGNAQVRTDVYKYGTGSMYFDGNGDYLRIPDSELFNMGTADFTVECWYKHGGAAGSYPSILSGTAWSGGGVGLRFNNLGSNKFAFFWNGIGDPWLQSANTFSTTEWHHVALTRSGNTFTLWVNGVAEATGTNSGSIDWTFGGDMYIGWGPWDAGNGYLNAYLDDLRITRGVARYTSNFTPPDKALPVQ